jgi:predicted DCC family thiol-disulfide oxidoreductase YuxK
MSSPEPGLRIVVFDGHCFLCSGWARFLHQHRIEPPFRLLAMQSAAGRELLSENGIDPDDPTTFLVLDRGRRLTESDAAIHIVSSLGGPWRLVEVARVLPARLRNVIYRFIARNRFRLFGRRATCYLPP